MAEIVETNIEKEMQSSYIDYAMSVIIGRALPDVRDGLKPAHRRILYAMYKLNNTHNQPTKKSARVVGTVIGQYHPHGDIAAYDTLVRMAQNFSMNHTFVEGQGNMGCFTKDTKIRLADGRDLNFEQLIDEQSKGKRHWTFALNTDNGLIEVTEIKNPRLTRKNAGLIEVTLDNGEKIRCTPDHRFLLHNGTYEQAKNLSPGTSLMPLYTKISDGTIDKNLRGYEMVMQPKTNEWQFIHHISDQWNLVGGIYARSNGRVRHHIDFNKRNNNPDNIRRMDWKEHWRLHYELASWRHKTDPEYVRKLAEGRTKFYLENRDFVSKRQSERNKRDWKNPKYRAYHSQLIKDLWKNESYRNKHIEASRKNLKLRWTKPEFKELMGKYKSKEMKARWANPEYRSHMQQVTRDMSNNLWDNPEHRAKISSIIAKRTADPVWKRQASRRSKSLWDNPNYRSKFSKEHFIEAGKKAWRDEKYRSRKAEQSRMQWENPEFRVKITNEVRERGMRLAKEHPEYFKMMAGEAAKSLHIKWKDPSYKNRIIRHKILGFASSLLSKYETLTPEIYDSERKNNCIPKSTNTLKYFDTFDQMIALAKVNNHKVKSIVFLEEKEDVYDITTDPWHNFSLSAGVFVHNSIDGDSPAAQRYTEVRLTTLAEEMLEDLDKEAVKMVPNFDNTEEEPLLLPAKVPNLLINGSSGIAVGVATNIMPHNLSEVCDGVVAYLQNSTITSEQLLAYVKGPDLPTGGTIFYNEGLLASYLKGRGAVVIRSKVEREKIKNKEALVVTEIPYTVNKAALVSQIAELVKDKRVAGISDMRDETGKEEGGIGARIVIELKPDAEPEYVLNQLYKHSQLQISLPVMNIAVLGNSLLTMQLRDFIKHFVDHRISVIKNRSSFDLRVATDRLHLVEGLLVALENIEEIVALIKGSKELKDARAGLIQSYTLSEKQANAILDMKLSKLTGLERGSLETEKTDLKSRIGELESILADENKVLGIIKAETEYIKLNYGRPRRTVIDNSTPLLIEREDLIQDDDATIILTRNNYIKRIDSGAYREQARGGKGIIAIQLKEGDFVKQIISCRTKDYLLILSNTGRAYWLKAYMVPEEGRYGSGKAAVNLVKFAEGEKAETIINTRTFANAYLTFITSKGKIKRVTAESFSRPRANGIRAINMLEGDTLADVCLSDGKSELFIATRKGKALRFSETDIRPMGREAVGVRAIRLAPDDVVLNIIAAKSKDQILSIAELGFGKITPLDEYRLQRRGGKGVLNIKIKDKTGFVIRALNASQNGNVVLINSRGVSISFPTGEIRVTGRAASGVRLMKLDSGVKIVDAQILPVEPEVPKPTNTS
ncbi:MAG: hypothetical protein KGH94_05065 [Candidatus Micrarchaeota archaeon]|nr:hypothetical protein [Candidatus Micrarchaeota archaeon]